MKINVLRNIILASMLASTALVTGCSQTVTGNDNELLNGEQISEKLAMMSAVPNFKQTALDEIEYVTTFSSWAEASETLGLDLAPCSEDDHAVNYNVLPNYSILQTEFGVGVDTFDMVQPDNDFQTDGWMIGEGLTDGVIESDNGVVGGELAYNQSNGVESITVFLPNSKNAQSTTLLKLSDRISVDDDELYRYFNDFNSIASSRDVQWKHIKTVQLDLLGVDVDFYTADSTQLFAFMIYDDCLFQLSYGFVDENNVEAVVNSITL